MTERDPISRQLMLARSTSWAPAAAKARVRANLAAGGALSAASGARAAGVTKLTTALLVGASFVAGYWLGFRHSREAPEAATPSTAARAPERAAPAAAAHVEAAEGAAREPASPEAITASGGASATLDARAHGAHPARSESASGESASGSKPAAAEEMRSARSMPAASAAPATAARRAASGRRAPSNELDAATPGRARLARAPASRDPGAEELALLARTERAIRAGEPALAVSFLDELDARFPSSTLLEERSAARLLADCALSNPGSRRRAELFLSDRAASVYTDRLRRSCGLEAAAPSQPPLAPPGSDGSSRGGH
jgi:hypothetical protein